MKYAIERLKYMLMQEKKNIARLKASDKKAFADLIKKGNGNISEVNRAIGVLELEVSKKANNIIE